MIIYETPNIISQIGTFNGSVETKVNPSGKTKESKTLLRRKKKRMDDNILEELRSLIKTRFGNDIDKFADCVGKSTEEILSFLNGETDIPPELFEDYIDCASKGAGSIQIGDKYVEIYNRGNYMTNNYAGLMKGAQIEIIKKIKAENAKLKEELKEQKELIESQKEIIKLLKEKK